MNNQHIDPAIDFEHLDSLRQSYKSYDQLSKFFDVEADSIYLKVDQNMFDQLDPIDEEAVDDMYDQYVQEIEAKKYITKIFKDRRTSHSRRWFIGRLVEEAVTEAMDCCEYLDHPMIRLRVQHAVIQRLVKNGYTARIDYLVPFDDDKNEICGAVLFAMCKD
jgi:hypothetical protein